jgi:raffinose/stachyose/melibiose transport system substrate-binding protein
MSWSRFTRYVGAVMALLLVAAACSPPGAGGGDDPTTTAAAADTTADTGSGDDPTTTMADGEARFCEPGTTLEFWYQTSGPEGLARFEQVSRMFEERHEDLTIEVTAITFDDMRVQMPLALDGGGGPDIAYVSPLDQGSGLFARGGHLLELTDIAEELGWTDRFPMQIVEYNNVANPGQIFGFPYKELMVGVFYNEEIYNELGLDRPTTFEEFENILATVRDAGYTPVSVGGLTGWPLAHVFEQLLHLTTPIEHIAQLEQLNPDYNYDADTIVEAAAKTLEWHEAGYYNDDVLSTSYADANTLFVTEQVVMNIGGTWAAPEFGAAETFTPRFYAMPPMDSNREWNAGGHAVSDDFIIPRYTEHQDCAVSFLDFILDEEVMTYLWTEGDLVSYQFDELPPATSQLQEDMYTALANTGPGYYMGVVNAEVNNANWEGLQRMIAGELTPREAFELVQRVYEEQIALQG